MMKLIISAKEDLIKDFSKSCQNACCLLFVGPDVKDFFATRLHQNLEKSSTPSWQCIKLKLQN
jgi:hypothetical protein